MTWADFYLICFLLGLALSLLSVLTGSAHLHLPHVHVHVPHVHVPHADMGGAEAEGVPWLNFGTMTAFLAWFGGTGYLLERFYAVWFLVALAIAVLSRLGGTGEIVFSQEGVRRVSGARSDDGTAISKGTEVVVQRYEKGIAYVRRWEDMAGSAEDLAVKES